MPQLQLLVVCADCYLARQVNGVDLLREAQAPVLPIFPYSQNITPDDVKRTGASLANCGDALKETCPNVRYAMEITEAGARDVPLLADDHGTLYQTRP